ncbi:MAG: hypothetical protein QM492_12645 [Rhodobacterales bacterium]
MIDQITFMRGDWQQIRRGNRAVLGGWLAHMPAVTLVLFRLMTLGTMPL